MHLLLRYIHTHQQSLYTADWGLARTRAFLHLLGNPQYSFTPIHVAGTSGKTSTSVIIAQLLHAQGQSVGLTVSPHIYSETERFWVNGQNPSEEEFNTLLHSLQAPLMQMKASRYGLPTYFEFLICASFMWFAQKNVKYAVVEVGLGGLFDSTNVLNSARKYAVISSIGFDHQAILGNTLSEIAAQKAGIIHHGNTVIAVAQKAEAMKQIQHRAVQVGASHLVFSPSFSAENPLFLKKNTVPLFYSSSERIDESEISFSEQGCTFMWKKPLQNPVHHQSQQSKKAINQKFFLPLRGKNQVENALLALNTLYEVNNHIISEQTMTCYVKAMANIHVPARIEMREISVSKRLKRAIIIDGAHNPEKVSNIAQKLHLYVRNKEVDVLIAIKKDKSADSMIQQLFSAANVKWGTIYTTEFSLQQDLFHESISSHELTSIVQSHFNSVSQQSQRVQTLPAINNHLFHRIIHTNPQRPLLIIGSLYLAAEVMRIINDGKK